MHMVQMTSELERSSEAKWPVRSAGNFFMPSPSLTALAGTNTLSSLHIIVH